MKIITIPNPILYKVSEPITKIDEKLKKTINEMMILLDKTADPEGTGLSAPQVGISLRFYIAKPDLDEKAEVYINPKIIKSENFYKKTKKEKIDEIPLEGCLSVPKIWGEVKRFNKVIVEYQNLEGKILKKEFTDLEAITAQHEIDHLNGIIFTMRVLEQNGKLFEEKNGELIPIKNII